MNDIEQALQSIKDMPHGSAQAEAARALWDRARQEAPPPLRYEVLMETLSAAMFGGSKEYFLALFPQLVALKKEHPEAVDGQQYVWRLKWLVNNLTNYPEIPDERIRQAENQYADALREVGGSQRTAIYLRWKNAMWQGRQAQAAELLPQFHPMRRDEHADCLACEVNALVQGAIFEGDLPRALEAARPVTHGRMRCAEVPHATYGYLLLPALRSGMAEEAAVWHRKGYALIRGNVEFVTQAGLHFLYLAATGDAARFLRLLRVHLPWLEQNLCPQSHLTFMVGASAGCEMAAETGQRRRAAALPLPRALQAAWGAEPLPMAELARKFQDRAQELAAAFDRRNGNSWNNDYVTRTLAEVREYRREHPAVSAASDADLGEL